VRAATFGTAVCLSSLLLAPAGARAQSANPPAEEPIEVIVRAERPPDVTSLSRAEVRRLPGAFGDPFRAVEAMPGVTPVASGVPYFFVRGAPPGNVGYFLDGVRVPLLFHVGLGPSVVHPALVERVDLYSGGYPAQFGRFAGGIVTGETKPAATEWHGEGNVRLFDAGAFVEGPFADGRGAALVSGRFSYSGLILSAISPDVDLAYADYQARVSYALTPRDTLTAFAFGSRDRLVNEQNTAPPFDTTFHRLDLRYDHRFGPSSTLRQAVTLGYDLVNFGRPMSAKSIASRTEVSTQVSDAALLRFGADAVLDSNKLDLYGEGVTPADSSARFLSRADFQAGLRGDAVIQVTPRLEVTPGVRVDVFGSGGRTAGAVDPRLSARLAVTKSMRLVQAYGLASQMPSLLLPGFGFQPDLEGGLQRSFQASAGVELELPLDVHAKVIFFRNAFFNLTDSLGARTTSNYLIPSQSDTRTDGQSTGLEVNVHRRLTRQLGGFFSYTLSRSTRNVGRYAIPSTVDRTHVANLAATYNFGGGYHAGGRVVFYTGTPVVGPALPVDPSSTGRLPPFFRLDVRLEKRWVVAKRYWISLVVEVLNATATKETIAIQCTGVTARCEPETLGPVTIPSVGVEAGF
jgi:hypothetical protein